MNSKIAFPVSDEMAAALFMAKHVNPETRNIHSIGITFEDECIEVDAYVHTNLIAVKPSYWDWSDIETEEYGAAPTPFYIRPIQFDGELSADEMELRPLVHINTTGELIYTDTMGIYSDNTDGVQDIAVTHISEEYESIGLDKVMNDSFVAAPFRPTINVHTNKDIDSDLCAVVMLNDERAANVFHVGDDLYIEHTNNPMFSGLSDLVTDHTGCCSGREYNDVITAVYEHWLMCNAAGIEQ